MTITKREYAGRITVGIIAAIFVIGLLVDHWPGKAHYMLTAQGSMVYRLNTITGTVQVCEMTDSQTGYKLANCSRDEWP